MIAEALTIFKVQLVKTTNCENYAPDASVAFSSGMIKSGLSLVVRTCLESFQEYSQEG
ncbi:MAG: hypothetical protein L0L96_04130 [Lactiplantibacillus plantarum]|nr:hypothetical protein [Lactiplantibacillus plantarum]